MAYDVANIFLEGIKAGKTTRADLLAFLRRLQQGGRRHRRTYKFDANGELDPAQVMVWAFKVNGRHGRAGPGDPEGLTVRSAQRFAVGSRGAAGSCRSRPHPSCSQPCREPPLNFDELFGNFPELTITGLAQGAIYALVALGYTLVYGVLRLINFAHSEVFMVGTFAALWTWGCVRARPELRRPAASARSLLLIARRRWSSPRWSPAATALVVERGRLPAAAQAQRPAAGLPDHRDRRVVRARRG